MHELDTTKLRTYEQKVQDYEAIYKFKIEQMVKYLQQSLHIMEDVSLSPQDKEKKIKNLWQKLLRKEVYDHAEKLHTCIKDRRTFRSAHLTPQCPLHIHCIGGKKWLDELIKQVTSVTLLQNFAQPFAESGQRNGADETPAKSCFMF